MKDEHVKDAAQDVAEDVAEDVPQDVAQDFAFGARAAHALLATPPPPPPPSLCSSRLDWGTSGQLSGIWLGLWASASMFILPAAGPAPRTSLEGGSHGTESAPPVAGPAPRTSLEV